MTVFIEKKIYINTHKYIYIYMHTYTFKLKLPLYFTVIHGFPLFHPKIDIQSSLIHRYVIQNLYLTFFFCGIQKKIF